MDFLNNSNQNETNTHVLTNYEDYRIYNKLQPLNVLLNIFPTNISSKFVCSGIRLIEYPY